MPNFKLLTAPLLLLLTLPAIAQVSFDAGLTFGITTSQIHGDKFSGFSKFGLQGGGTIDMGLNDKSSLMLEIMYTQKGSRNAPNLSDGNENVNVFKWKLDYAEIPVSYRYRFDDRFSAHAGLYYAQFVTGYEEINGNRKSVGSGSAYANGDVGFQVGGQMAAGEHSFLRVRYSNSIIPMRDENVSLQDAVYWNGGGYNIVLYLSYGLWF